MKFYSFTIVLLFSSLIHISNGHAVDRPRPNVIVVYTDDQGYGDASCLNSNAKFKTPNLDRLAAEGISFTDAHCSDAVCTPSRYGLLTGRYCWRTSLKKGVMGAEGDCLIADGRMTVASLMRDAGYNTAMVGKWHLGMDFPGEPGKRDWSQPVRNMPLDKGFDYFFGIPASLNYGVLAWFRGRQAKVPPTLFTNKKPNDRHVDYRIMPPYEKTPEETRAKLKRLGMEVAPDFVDSECLTRFTDEAIGWMQSKTKDAKSGKPFFLYLPYTSPHYPVCPLPQFHGQGDAGAYGEFVIETDHHVGRILKFLDSTGLDENTMLIFTSDNGPENSWKARIKEFGHHSNGTFREGKRSIYEGGHRVPFFIRWPAGIADPGRKWTRAIGQTDVLATLAEMLDARIPSHAAEDSESFFSVLQSNAVELQRSPIVHHASNGRFAVRDGDWKLVMPHARHKAELYNLAEDPAETRDVMKQHAEIVERLQAKITKIVREGRSTPGEPQKNDTGYWKDLAWMTEDEY